MAQLTLTRTSDGSVQVHLGVPGMAGVEGEIPADAIEVAQAHLQQLEQGQAGVVLPSAEPVDHVTSRQEQELGTVLGELLTASSPELNAQLRELLGRAQERSQLLVLGLETQDEPLQALPWELTGLPRSLESEGRAVVVRLVPGQATSARSPAPALQSRRWAPQADAPEVAEILEGLPAETEPDTEAAQVLHLVCHGSLLEDEMVWVGNGERKHMPGDATHALQPLLQDSSVVLCHTCHGGASASEQLADRAIGAGARVVLAPVDEISVEASLAFSEQLLAQLERGASMATALVEGRRAILALHDPGAQARWWKMRCFVSNGSQLGPIIQAQKSPHAPAQRRSFPAVYGLLLIGGLGLAYAWGRPEPSEPVRETPAVAEEPEPVNILPTEITNSPVPPGAPAALEQQVQALLADPSEAPDELNLDWVTIEGGCFWMRTDDSFENEQPVHEVCLPGFALSRSEVTVEQYALCVAQEDCEEPATAEGCNWSQPDRSDHPINCVSWFEAQRFAAWAQARLPSESEWEYAARSRGKAWIYPWGDEAASCQNAVIGSEQGDGCGLNSTAPVCSKSAGQSAEGICDLVGNVWEWTADTWHDSYSGAHEDGSPWLGEDKWKVSRGGSYQSTRGNLRASNRHRDHQDGTTPNFGFRLAR
jgi:formylglycine-generating enzyme required for sulfatase activity